MESPALNNTLAIIHEEHKCLAAVIKAMRHFARLIAEGGKAPGFKVFRAMLLYISEYPEKIHHPKEDAYLFVPLRRRTAEADNAIEALEAQHAQGERMVRELEHALTRYELLGPGAFQSFHELVEQYAGFYFEHMRLEEEAILPLAKKVLTKEDWAEADKAFAANRDPLAGVAGTDDFDRLFRLIVTITPAPLGVGPEIE